MPFFVGCGRSGTTLLRAMFDSHPAMAVPPESHFIVPMAHKRRRYERRGEFRIERFCSDLLADPRFKKWEITGDDLKAALSADPPAGLADAFRRTYGLYADRRGKVRAADKTPGYVRHLSLLAGLFPEAVFVHVIRDGRDVALSLREVEFGPQGLGRAALFWKRAVQSGRDAGRHLGPRYLEVRYEDLVGDPPGTLAPVLAAAGLDYDDAMLRYPERAETVVSGTLLPHRHRHLFEPPVAGLRDWRSQMTPSEVELFEILAGDLLADLGYGRTGIGASLRTRALAGRARVDVRAIARGAIPHRWRPM
jgi:hypothetical protein